MFRYRINPKLSKQNKMTPHTALIVLASIWLLMGVSFFVADLPTYGIMAIITTNIFTAASIAVSALKIGE